MFKKPSLSAFCVAETVVKPPSFDVLIPEADEIFSSPLNRAAVKLVLSKSTVTAELNDEKSLFNTSISTVFGELNAEIWMSSPSAFSMTICFLSEERFATTPVLPEKLFKKANLGGINIHPSLLPKYKGLNTHERAIKNKDKFAGASIHKVTEKLDSGKVILQKKVKILKSDSVKSLEKKVLKIEHEIYPKAIDKFLTNL